MASVDLRPGDTLNIIWSSVQDTPLGSTEIESSFQFTYEDLLVRLKAKGREGRSRRSGTEGARFSRLVALSYNALKKGCWSTGAEIDRKEVFDRLVDKLEKLGEEEYKNTTENARKFLKDLTESKSILKASQRNALKERIKHLGIDL